MRHAYKSGASPSPPPPPAAPSLGYPTEGSAAGNVPATVLGPHYFYAVAQEIISVIEGAGLTPSDSATQLRDAIDRGLGPPGALLDYAGADAPPGWLVCDGSAVSRTTYAALFAAIGTTWGAGDGSTTFHLPDFRRRVAVGAGGAATAALGSTVGSIGGAETEALTVAQIPSHSHGSGTLATSREGEHSHSITIDSGTGATRNVPDRHLRVGDPATVQTAEAGAHHHEITGSTAETGGAGAHNNLPPSAVVTKLIKT